MRVSVILRTQPEGREGGPEIKFDLTREVLSQISTSTIPTSNY